LLVAGSYWFATMMVGVGYWIIIRVLACLFGC